MIRQKAPFERLRSWLPLIPLLLLLAGTYWLNQQVKPFAPKTDDSMRHEIDYFIENLSSVTLDEQGKARYLMTSEKMWHYPDDDSTFLNKPRIVSLPVNGWPVITSSRTGKISSHGNEVFLYDDVTVVRLPELEKDKLSLSTDYLHVLPDDEQADTDHPVMLVTQRETINATGMSLDNKLQTVRLLSKVHATNVPLAK